MATSPDPSEIAMIDSNFFAGEEAYQVVDRRLPPHLKQKLLAAGLMPTDDMRHQWNENLQNRRNSATRAATRAAMQVTPQPSTRP